MTRHRRFAAVALVLLALAGAIAWTYASDLRRAHARLAGNSAVADTPCGPIEHASVGQGPAVLFVHGAGGGFDQGLGMAHELAARSLRVILVSRFGYLRTPLPPDASPAAQADAHACVLDALRIDRAAIVGVSAGAPSSLQFALRYPDRTRALVLLVPATYAPRAGGTAPPPPATELLFDTALRSDFLFWIATRVARDTLIESILATPPAVVKTASLEEQQRVDALLQSILPVSTRRLGLLNDAKIMSTLRPEPLERVTAPALVVSVQDDGFGTWDSARHAAAHLPRARLVGWERGGHVWVGHHRELVDELVAFVRAGEESVGRK
jgi:pimeloyl-ACP methyl ester carboxylesterase